MDNWKGVNEVLATMKEFFENDKLQSNTDILSGNGNGGGDTGRARHIPEKNG